MKNLKIHITLLIAGILTAKESSDNNERTKNFPKLPPIIGADIAGAPTLGQPYRLEGNIQEIRVEKHGLVYPAFFDWNKDGKKDLLLGEFETGETGSNIKVYLNEGNDKKPHFTGEYFYATDINGNTITNHQWCCIGIHPRIVDMNGDGHLDILSGQYYPGKISWFKGSKDGFLPRVFIDQEGYVEGKRYERNKEPWSPEAWAYWNYTSADFADFNGDGLLDLWVGGTDGFRVALNIGSKENPSFGVRKYLHHLDGSILTVNDRYSEQIELDKENSAVYLNLSGVGKGYVKPIDWDEDGVLDLLITHEYDTKGQNPVEFFKGVNTDLGLRFETKKALITTTDGQKALPGCQPMITVVDYNNDGVQDIVIGISIPTVNGFEVADEIAYRWIREIGIRMPGKDPGRSIKSPEDIEKKIKEIETGNKWLKRHYLGNLVDYKYLTLRHRGYVLVFEGTKNKKIATAKKQIAKTAYQRVVHSNEQIKTSKADGPVVFHVTAPNKIWYGKDFEIAITFKLEQGWHLYSEKNNKPTLEGLTPPTVNIELDENLSKVDQKILPKVSKQSNQFIYRGNEVYFTQKFKLKNDPFILRRDGKFKQTLKVKVKINFQACNEEVCLPPEKHILELAIRCSHF